MITVRITRNIFRGEYECVRLQGTMFASDLKKELGIAYASLFRQGEPLDDKDIVSDGDFIIAQIIPKGMTTATAIILAFSIVAAVASIGITMSMLSSIPSMKKLQTNPSLRGSTNSARKNQMLPILLGKHRVYPDIAALPFSRYEDNDQYLRQLFCFGYRNTSIDESTLKIGETLLEKYKDYAIGKKFDDLYSQRCIESSISLKLSNGGEPEAIERTTASNTWKICIGIMAPSGISGEDDETADVGIRIEYRISGSESWTTAVEETLSLNCDKFRKMYEITPSSPGTFDVRVTRTNAESDSASVIDTVYLDVMQSWTQDSKGSKAPVINPERFSLLSLELRATDQLNGIIDELNAVCTLQARIYRGQGTGPEAWATGDATNPAAVILYLLTDQYANPSPLSDDEIVWDEFEAFYEYCEDHDFQCNAYISSEDYSIEDICSFIAESNLAQIRHAGRKVGITIDAAVNHYTQLFTPRNAWNFSVQRSFSQDVRYFRIKYVDASIGYEETERTVSVDTEGNIVFDAPVPDDESGTEINLVGVTDPAHAAYVGRQRLRSISRQKRTFTWTSDVEAILCVPGDVVLMEHSQFSIGLGEGRIKEILKDGNGIVNGAVLDSAMPFESNKIYSVIIRSITSISESITIRSWSEDHKTIYFSATPQYALRQGDLCAVGEYSKETIPLMVTTIERDENSNCKVTAVDYDPAIYEEGEIPPYDPGISKYPDAGDIGTGSHLPDGYIPPSTPGADGGDPRSLFQYTSSPFIAPDEGKAIMAWGTSVLAWGTAAFIIDTGVWSPVIPYPAPQGKPYLWEKYWSYELKEWQIFCRTAAPAPDFEITFIPSSYPLTSRGWTKEGTIIRAICRRRNSDGDIIWTIPSSLSYTIVEGSNNATIDIVLPEALLLPDFQIACHVQGAGTKSYTVSGIREGKEEPIYLQHIYSSLDELNAVENTSGGPLLYGDHALVEDSSGNRTPYYWTGTEWKMADETTPADLSWLMLQNVLFDATAAPGTIQSQSFVNIFAKNMAVFTAMVYNLMVRNLRVGSGSASSGFQFDIYDYQNGNKVTPIIRARYNGRTIFQIDPSSGKVFFGQPNSNLTAPSTGFMFDPSTEEIRSASGRFRIDSDGYLHATGANVRGSITATSGTFTGNLNCQALRLMEPESRKTYSLSTYINGPTQAKSLIQGLVDVVSDWNNILPILTDKIDLTYFNGRMFKIVSSSVPGAEWVSFSGIKETLDDTQSPSVIFYDNKGEGWMLKADAGLDWINTSAFYPSSADANSIFTESLLTGFWINTSSFYLDFEMSFGDRLILNVPIFTSVEESIAKTGNGQIWVDKDGFVRMHIPTTIE